MTAEHPSRADCECGPHHGSDCTPVHPCCGAAAGNPGCTPVPGDEVIGLAVEQAVLVAGREPRTHAGSAAVSVMRRVYIAGFEHGRREPAGRAP